MSSIGQQIRKCIAVLAIALGVVALGQANASASYWAAYRWSGNGTFPNYCLYTGTNIPTEQIPYKHNVSAGDSCQANYTIFVDLYEYNSHGQIIDYFYGNGARHAFAGGDVSTPSGAYWIWDADIGETGTFLECSNQGYPFYYCYSN